MPEEREDYIIRLIQELRQFVTRVLRLRDAGSMDEALLAVVHARERLFGRPSAEFAHLPIDEQLGLLAEGESPATSDAKRIAYATILKEAGLVYDLRAEREMALSAFQLSLYITLVVAIGTPGGAEELRGNIEELLNRIPEDQLYPPVKALLGRLAS